MSVSPAALFDALRQDVVVTLRSLGRNPVFLLTVVFSLGLGIGAGAAAFGVIEAVRFRALPFPEADRLVVISEVPDEPGAPSECRGVCDVAYTTYANVLRDRPFRTLELVVAYTSGGKALNTGDAPIVVTGGVVSPNAFEMLDARPLLGRTFTRDDDRLGAVPVVILAHSLWTTHFGADPAILGRTVKLSDTQYTVIGVMQPGFEFERASEFWLPVVPTLDPSTLPSIRSVQVFARLSPGHTVEQAAAELATVDIPRVEGGSSAATRLEVMPLRERYTTAMQSHDVIFAAVVGCVLLIACANVANLVLVRSIGMQRELAIRAAMGAGSARLGRLLLTQNAILAILGAAVGVVFASKLLDVLAGVAVLDSLRPSGMEYELNGRVAVFAVALAGIAAAGLTLLPARYVARMDLQRLLRDAAPTLSAGRRFSRAQRVFVVAQVASAAVLLIGAGVMVRTMVRLARIDPGFDASRLLRATPSLPHPWRVEEKFVPLFEQILQELRAVSGAEAVAMRAAVPLASRGSSPELTPDGQAVPLARSLVPSSAFSVSDDYFRVLGIPLLRGRAFDSRDRQATTPVVVVNDVAARQWWPGEDPIARTVRVGSPSEPPITLTVVGVVADNRAAQPSILTTARGPELYRPFDQARSAFPTFFVRATQPAAVSRDVRSILARLVPDRPVFATPVADDIAEQLAGVRTNALQIAGFATIGLALALIGVYGVTSYSIGRRTREIAIRRALGASPRKLQLMVLADTGLITVIGLSIGLPGALLASGVLLRIVESANTSDPLVYATVGVIILALALVAGLLAARRATRVSASAALRA